MRAEPVSVSVIVPCFRGERHLAATLDSLLAQTRPIHEVIVVDDGSPDGSCEIASRHELQPLVLRRPNLGVAFARNFGVSRATGTHVAFLDQDDLWAPTRHARLVGWLEEHDECSALVTPCTAFVRADDIDELHKRGDRMHEGARVVRDPADLMAKWPQHDEAPVITARIVDRAGFLEGPQSLTASYVIERELLQSAGGCVPFARSFDDYLALLNVSLATSVWLVDEPSVLYRIHPESTTLATDWSLPLLTGIAAVRHGANVVPSGHARDSEFVPALLGERRFVLHWLLELAVVGRLRDAIALTRLLGVSRREQQRVVWMLSKRYVRARWLSR